MKKGKNNSIPLGTIDYYGKEAILRKYILSNIERIYMKYGFEPLYTPIIENEDVFKGHHGEGEKLLFKLQDKTEEKYVLKYDSTVPLARVVSMYDDIKLPYKRFQLQQSYRDDEIDKGHYREFIQCDGDIVGAFSVLNDAEIIMIASDVLQTIGFKDYTIRLNHRKFIQAIAKKANMSSKEKILEIQRAIDYADKVLKSGITGIKKDLKKRNINEKVIEIIIDLVNISESSNGIEESLENIDKYFFNNIYAREGIDDMKKIISMLPKNVKSHCKLDFTLARGADYYTGFIIEAVINNIKLGAVLGGGRYDNLVSAFSNKQIPAVGMAFGMERLIVALKELKLDKNIPYDEKIALYTTEENSLLAFNITKNLRKKYNVTVLTSKDIPSYKAINYCKDMMISYFCSLKVDGDISIKKINNSTKIKELYLQKDIEKIKNELQIKNNTKTLV